MWNKKLCSFYSFLFVALSQFFVDMFFVSAFIFALILCARSHRHTLLVSVHFFFLSLARPHSLCSICMQVNFIKNVPCTTQSLRIRSYLLPSVDLWIWSLCAFYRVYFGLRERWREKWEQKEERLWDWKSFEMARTTTTIPTTAMSYRYINNIVSIEHLSDTIIMQSVLTIIAIHSHHRICSIASVCT